MGQGQPTTGSLHENAISIIWSAQAQNVQGGRHTALKIQGRGGPPSASDATHEVTPSLQTISGLLRRLQSGRRAPGAGVRLALLRRSTAHRESVRAERTASGSLQSQDRGLAAM